MTAKQSRFVTLGLIAFDTLEGYREHVRLHANVGDARIYTHVSNDGKTWYCTWIGHVFDDGGQEVMGAVHSEGSDEYDIYQAYRARGDRTAMVSRVMSTDATRVTTIYT